MSQLYARPLNEKKLVEEFLKSCLAYSNKEFGNTVLKILKEELLIDTVPQHFSTLNDEKFRHPDYSSDQDCIRLRNIIFEELFQKTRLTNDNDIKLGVGGAKPENLIKGSQAIIVTGLPASGKSSIANKIADAFGAYIIDPDYAKLKLPEYFIFGANTVHKESSAIVRSSNKTEKEKNLLGACLYHKANIVIPTIGQSLNDIREERDFLKNSNYKVHLVLVSVKREVATSRALDRFLKDQRYVPLGLVFDGYANDPVLTYHRTKNDPEWDSYGKINTEGLHPIRLDSSPGSPVERIFATTGECL
ncbi:Zeta toxin [Cedecea neteri]|uniref:Zeta toxin n=1 Tax=Cedecea neteri TaxID=158822 RepID=A0A291E047_9ENTR|nr:zeta toxin family protein [Cedecea neteri]ATF93312.1 hypothetical protein CO704_14915 [Cedecea neteri]SQC93928.1 Zeta toxin [Cedecea neteri]